MFGWCNTDHRNFRRVPISAFSGCPEGTRFYKRQNFQGVCNPLKQNAEIQIEKI